MLMAAGLMHGFSVLANKVLAVIKGHVAHLHSLAEAGLIGRVALQGTGSGLVS